jgi:hypothetical protein
MIMDGIRKPRQSFRGGVVFAAFAAIALPITVLALAPRFGYSTAISLHLLLTAASYMLWLAPTRQHGLGGTAIGLVAIGVLWWAGPSHAPTQLAWHALSCAAVVSAVRSVHYFRTHPVRALVLELVLAVGGLMMVALLVGSSLLSQAAALWGYLLVQSLYTLAPGGRVRGSSDAASDRFDRASARLRRLLDES